MKKWYATWRDDTIQKYGISGKFHRQSGFYLGEYEGQVKEKILKDHPNAVDIGCYPASVEVVCALSSKLL